MSQVLARLSSPDSLSVAALLVGAYCVAAALGIAKGVQIAQLTLPSPEGKTGKAVLSTVGLGLVAIGIYRSISFPEYKPVVFVESIYEGNDARQIVADGQSVYLLLQSGKIFLVTGDEMTLVDNGGGTVEMQPAGGILYILKVNGNIWVYQSVTQARAFQMTDPGIGTRQMDSAGETLYVLKGNGNIWKSILPAVSGNQPQTPTFVRIDDGTQTRQISSSGSILYVLKDSGNIWRYAPVLGRSFEEIYTGRDAEQIKADGSALYFIRNDGTVCRYRQNPYNDDGRVLSGTSASCVVIASGLRAKKLDALGSVVYILTNQGKIFRYNAAADDLRELVEASDNNKAIAAYYQDLFVIKNDGSVKRYNEGRLRR